MLKTIKHHPFAISLYFFTFVLMFFPFSAKYFGWVYVFINILNFILINFLTFCYNRINNKQLRIITFQLMIASLVVTLLIIYNYFILFLDDPSYALRSRDLDVVIIQNILSFILWNPFTILTVTLISIFFDGSFWTPLTFESTKNHNKLNS